MVTREEFRKLFSDKAISADKSPGAVFSLTLTRLCMAYRADPDGQSITTYIEAFATSMNLLMVHLEAAIFGEEETNEG